MGGGLVAPTQQHPSHLVIIAPFPEPKHFLATLRRVHPNIHITFFDQTTAPIVPPSLYKSATVLCTWSHLPQNPQIEAPHLKWVHILSAKSKWLASQAIFQSAMPVQLTTSSGATGLQMAHWALSTWFAKGYKQGPTQSLYSSHGLASRQDLCVHSLGLHEAVGKRVGILGYGSIGRQVGRVAKSLGMQVVAYTSTKRQSSVEQEYQGYTAPGTGDTMGTIPTEWYGGADIKSLHDFLGANLDWLVVALPFTPRTRNILKADEFRILSHKHAFVSIITDGPVFSHNELLAALRNGLIKGAALNLTNSLHLSSQSPLWEMPNVTITPHNGIDDSMVLVGAFDILETNLSRLESGEKLVNLFTKSASYPRR